MSKEKFKYTKEFLEKVKNGDNDATTLLYEDAKDIAYNKAYSILNNHHDAEDIAEDSVLRAIEKIDTIKKPSEFPAWIRRVAENKAKDYIKKDKPTYMGEDFEYTTNDLNSNQKVLPEKMADSQENIDLYKKLISKLTDDQRNALVLNRIEGYKTREIAEMLGCSENTIKSRIHQGEKKLVKEAENLKKKGYTLNGMMPLDFFTVMSKSLGVTSTNVASVVGATVLKSLSMKIVASVVAVVIVVSGVVGVSYLYTKSDVTQNGYVSNVQMYQIIDKDETNYIKTLLAYISSSDKGDSSDYSKMTDSEILDVLNSYYMVTNNLKGAKDLFPSAQNTTDMGMPKKVVPQKDVQKVAKEVFGKTLSSSASSGDVELIDGNYYFAVPMGGKEYTLDIKNVEYNKNRSKVTVTYTFNSGYYGVNPTEYTATFTRNGNNKNFPFRLLRNEKFKKSTTKFKESTTVDLKFKIVPNVIGLTKEEASRILRKQNISVRYEEGKDNIYSKGIIADQNVKRGGKVRYDQTVTLLVSSGLKNIDDSEYILPKSDTKYISKREIKDMSKKELTLALNEIYARYGLMFNTTSVQKYFNSKDWYVPSIKPGHFDYSQFNDYERHNVDTIVNYMKEKGYR